MECLASCKTLQFRVAGGIMDHIRLKAIFFNMGQMRQKKIIVIVLSNIISSVMLAARYVNVIMFLTK